MADGKLAIIMPTYRFGATARHSISVLATMSSERVQVYIGDNSCNPAKWAFLDALAAAHPHFHVFKHATNLGANSNWLFLLAQQTHEFICFASDDDFFAPDYFLAGFEELLADPSCATASGLFVVLTRDGDALTARPLHPNDASSAIDRVTRCKALPYGVYRRATTEKFEKYLQDRPFLPSYMDQIHTYNLLAQGTFKTDRARGLYLYNNDNWSASTEFASDAKFYVMAGLPEGMQHLHHLNWAVDVAHFFASIYRPDVSDEVAAGLTDVIFRERMAEFRSYHQEHTDLFAALFTDKPNGSAALAALLKQDRPTPSKLFPAYFDVMECIDVEFARKYVDFVRRTLLPTHRAALERSPTKGLHGFLSFGRSH